VLIREDIRPLCNEHYSAMVEVGKLFPVSGTASEAQLPHWGCTQSGCAVVYDYDWGYHFSTTQGRLQGKHDSPYTCNEHQMKLYMKSYNRQSDTEVWQCPADGCTRTETVRVAA
jgi:hypothetical protein